MADPAGDNSTKIKIAKQAVSAIVGQLPKKAELRLIYFDGECDQVKVFNEVGNVRGREQQEMIIKKINGLLSTGSTPLAEAIRAAGKLVSIEMERGRKNDADVIVLTDGMDTCGGKPCDVVKELRRRGIMIRIHAIGFMVNSMPIAQAELDCMANASNGGYYPAGNYKQLVDALGVIRKKIENGSGEGDLDNSGDDEKGGLFLKRAR